MSQVEVDKIIPQSGTTLTIGDSGDTITVASGATLTGDLNASNLSSGTVPSARISGAYTGITEVGTLTGLTTTGNINLGDNDKAQFGTGNDLQIYHDGSNSYINETGTGGLIVKSGVIYFRNPSDQDMILAQSGGAISLYHNNVKKLETTSTGIAVTGGIALGGTGTANLLDDYEEGTWTPSVTAQTGTLTTTSSTGSYTKIGKAVTVNFRITITNAGTGTNGLFIGNFPFAAANANTLSAAAREDTVAGLNITASATGTTSLAFFNGASTMIGSGRAFSCSTTYFIN